MNIRPATIDDLDNIMAIWRQQVDFHIKLDPDYYSDYDDKYTFEDDRKYVSQAITQLMPQFAIAVEGSQVAGLIVFEPGKAEYLDSHFSEYGEIEELFVDREFRGQGIAQSLISYAESYFKNMGINSMKIQVSALNSAAIKLYQKVGYADRQHLMYKKI
jgi:ribosomal protein S18 acetylase RimI-like enzyme